MPGNSLSESRSPRPIPPKRSFADFDELDLSSPRPGTTKRLRIETEEAEEEAKTVKQQPKPLPLKRPHASLLEELVNPVPSSPAPKRYRPESVDSLVTQWVESASGSESYRERHCRSDTLLGHSDGDLIPRRLTKSAPNMEHRRDADGFALPPTPASTRSRSYREDAEDDSWYGPSVAPSVTSGSGRSSGKLVENPLYRSMHLASNNIYLRSRREQFPEHISSLIDRVRRDRDSPGPSADGLLQDEELEALGVGAPEADVQTYFQTKIFSPSAGTLKRSDRLPMAKRAVPQLSDPALNISTPVPDLLFGYNRDRAFPQQQTQLVSMGAEMVANSQDLLYPFFVIEFKADGPSGVGSLWVAENQGLGGSASCVRTAELLNKRLRECKNEKVQLIDSAAFFIAMNGTEARLYVSWKSNELDYYAKQVNSFLVQKPTEFVEFRKHALNIIEWGEDKRLTQIRESLDILLEESRKRTSEAAKSRRPPSDDSKSSSSRKRKSSSSRGRNTKAKPVIDHSGGAPPARFQQDDRYDSVQYAPPPASLQEDDRYDSSVQYAPPPASFQEDGRYDSSVQYAPPPASFQYNQGWSLHD